jgi:phosphoribosylformylglycinamidine (FGAM) synthase-like enzyme
MQAVQAYFRLEEREPTDVELEMIAQTWSEHCVHKTFRAKIDYTGPDGKTETIDGMLKTYMRAATEKSTNPGFTRPLWTMPASSNSTTLTTWRLRPKPTTTPLRSTRLAGLIPAWAA